MRIFTIPGRNSSSFISLLYLQNSDVYSYDRGDIERIIVVLKILFESIITIKFMLKKTNSLNL